jgi:YidC/Oxa1 family membrane protein insertase
MLVTANIFQPLIDVFEAVLKFFHNNVGVSWGWSIVLLTVLIRAILIPLTVKQFHSMQRLQAHMPELKALQAKYKEDKQRQQQEVMKFYQENKINPFGSCLPLAAQLPVFISLFYMLRTDLRKNICPAIQAAHHATAAHAVPCGNVPGAGFLFIHDLTNSATGATLVVLIVLYVGTQLGSSLLMTTQAMERNQRLLMLGMPVFFVLLVIRFPAGVLVYWITTNTWTILQQYVIKRRIGPVVPASAAVVSTAGGTSSGASRSVRSTPEPSGESGGLGTLIRNRVRAATNGEAPAAVAPRERDRATPPPPPRKKKKRSGRRR